MEFFTQRNSILHQMYVLTHTSWSSSTKWAIFPFLLITCATPNNWKKMGRLCQNKMVVYLAIRRLDGHT